MIKGGLQIGHNDCIFDQSIVCFLAVAIMPKAPCLQKIWEGVKYYYLSRSSPSEMKKASLASPK